MSSFFPGPQPVQVTIIVVTLIMGDYPLRKWIITILIIITDLGLESPNSNKVLEVELLEKFPQVGVTQVTLRRKMKMIIMIDYDDRAV